MSKFEKHFKMECEDAIEYAREKLDFFEQDAKLTCQEIGDGNINYVFRVEDAVSRRSVIIKHADTRTRSTGNEQDTDRNRIEVEALKKEAEFVPGSVPEIYLYDPVMCCVVMEDLKDYKNLRLELCAHKRYERLAGDITDFMAGTLLLSTDLVINGEEKRKLMKRFMNPGLCRITENLVYTYPYTDAAGSNVLTAENKEFFERELYQDEELRLEAAKLKEGFMSKAQSLIHGDLHSGSIFVREDRTMVLDPEFACYGPAGYDIGNVIANLIFAYANASVTMEHGKEREQFLSWLLQTITEIPDLFWEKGRKLLSEKAPDVFRLGTALIDYMLRDILQDTAGVAGLELNRRIVGSAKVKDITSIGDPEKRARAERFCVRVAKNLIKGRTTGFQRGMEYQKLILDVAEKELA